MHGPAAALTAVALVVGASARASGWAAQAAIALAAQWPPARRAILVDLGLDAPSLHDELGLANDEGVVDIVEYGVSLRVVRRPAHGGAFDLVPAGLYIPDAEAVLRSAAWARVLEEVARERATLLAWVPADAAGMEDLVMRAGAVIVLAAADESDAIVASLPESYAVLAVLTPPVAGPDEEPVVAAGVDELLHAARSAQETGGREPVFEIVPAAPGSGGAAPADATAAGSPPAEEAVAAAPAPPPVEDAAVLDEGRAAEPATASVREAMRDAGGVAAAEVAPPARSAEPAAAPARQPETPAAQPPPAARPLSSTAPAPVVPPPAVGGSALPAAEEPLVVAAGADELLHPEEPPPAADAPVPTRVAATGSQSAPARDPAREPARLSDEEFQRIRLPTDRVSRETLIADLRKRQRAARLAPPPDAEPGPGPAVATGAGTFPDSSTDHAREMRTETQGDDVALETLAPPGRTAPAARPRSRNPLVWTIVMVLGASAIAGSWRFLQGRLGARVEEPVPVPEPVAEAPPPAPLDELPYAVAMEAHTDLAAALRRLDNLARQEGFTFHIVPLEREGTLYYHIMSGPVADSATALALRDTLLGRRIKTTATPNDVRHAPLAFLIGDYGSLEAAVDAMTDLRRLDVPGYLLLTPAADGATAHRVYVGGFGSPAEAQVTRQLLRAAGVQDSLVTRTGSTP